METIPTELNGVDTAPPYLTGDGKGFSNGGYEADTVLSYANESNLPRTKF